MDFKIRKYENFHIVIWLLKDLCWVSVSKILGVIMILPTILLAIWITWKRRDSFSELVHNLAVCSWICANSVWMIGEFYYNDSLRAVSKVFFIFGITIIFLYHGKKILKKLVAKKKELTEQKYIE